MVRRFGNVIKHLFCFTAYKIPAKIALLNFNNIWGIFFCNNFVGFFYIEKLFILNIADYEWMWISVCFHFDKGFCLLNARSDGINVIMKNFHWKSNSLEMKIECAILFKGKCMDKCLDFKRTLLFGFISRYIIFHHTLNPFEIIFYCFLRKLPALSLCKLTEWLCNGLFLRLIQFTCSRTIIDCRPILLWKQFIDNLFVCKYAFTKWKRFVLLSEKIMEIIKIKSIIPFHMNISQCTKCDISFNFTVAGS